MGTRRRAREAAMSRLLVFNLATDADDPLLAFTTVWLNRLAEHYDSVDVITMRAGRLDVARQRARLFGWQGTRLAGSAAQRRVLSHAAGAAGRKPLRGLLRPHDATVCGHGRAAASRRPRADHTVVHASQRTLDGARRPAAGAPRRHGRTGQFSAAHAQASRHRPRHRHRFLQPDSPQPPFPLPQERGCYRANLTPGPPLRA